MKNHENTSFSTFKLKNDIIKSTCHSYYLYKYVNMNFQLRLVLRKQIQVFEQVSEVKNFDRIISTFVYLVYHHFDRGYYHFDRGFQPILTGQQVQIQNDLIFQPKSCTKMNNFNQNPVIFGQKTTDFELTGVLFTVNSILYRRIT